MRSFDSIEETFWAWLAGLIDGEGYINLHKTKNPRCKTGYAWKSLVVITNNHKPVLEFIQQKIETGALYTRPYKKREKEYNPTYDLRFYGNTIRVLIPKLLPYLQVKRERAILLLEALKYLKRGAMTKTRLENLERVRAELKKLP